VIWQAFEKPVDGVQQAAMVAYTSTAALCALNLALSHGWHQRLEAAWRAGGTVHFAPARLTATAQAEELLTDLVGYVSSHCMLLLATVVHQTPDLHPFDYLLHMMHMMGLVLLTSAALRFARYMGEAGLMDPGAEVHLASSYTVTTT